MPDEIDADPSIHRYRSQGQNYAWEYKREKVLQFKVNDI